MWEWRRSRINRAAHDLPPRWDEVTLLQRHSVVQCPSLVPAGRRAAHLRSVAGQGHAQRPRVTLPRVRPDQAKRSEAGSHRYAVACVPIMVGIAVPIMVGIMVVIVVSDRVTEWHSRNCSFGRHRVA